MATDYEFYFRVFTLAIAFLAGFFLGRLSMAIQVASFKDAMGTKKGKKP